MVSFPGAASDANKLSQCQSNGSTSPLKGTVIGQEVLFGLFADLSQQTIVYLPMHYGPKTLPVGSIPSHVSPSIYTHRHTCPCTCCTQLPFASTFRLRRGPNKHTCRMRNLYLSFGSATVGGRNFASSKVSRPHDPKAEAIFVHTPAAQCQC